MELEKEWRMIKFSKKKLWIIHKKYNFDMWGGEKSLRNIIYKHVDGPMKPMD